MMRRFRFRFATVMKLRKTREEEALRVLGAAQRKYQLELALKAQFMSDLNHALERRERLGDFPIGIDAFHLEQNHIDGLKFRILQKGRDIVRASKKVEQALKTYLHTRRQTRVMEILEEKDRAEFKKLLRKQEQKEQDELVILRDRLREKVA